MPYGTIKVDTITFTAGGVDTSVSISGLVQNPTFTGNITSTGTISGNIIQGGTTVSGATVTGTAGQFGTLTGNTAGFTTVTGATVTGTTANFVTVSGTTVTGGTARFTTLTGVSGVFTTATITSGVFASGTAAAPSVSVGSTTNGIFSPGTNQLAIATSGTTQVTFGGPSVQFPIQLVNAFTPNSERADILIGSNATSNNAFRLGTLASSNGITLQGTRQNDSSLRTNLILQPDGASVGIGNTSVNALLEVNQRLADSEVLRVEGAFSASSSVVLTNWRRSGGAVAAAFKYNDATTSMSLGTTTSHKFFLRTADTDALTIDTSQRVGIGISTPGLFAANALVVEKATTSGITISESTGAGSAVLAFAATSAFDNKARIFSEVGNANLKFATSGSTAVTIDASQRVGIGTTSPQSILHLAGTSTQLILDPGSGSTDPVSINSWRTNAPIVFKPGDAERVRIDGSGRLLVGTSTARTGWDNTIIGSNLIQVERGIDGGNTSISICANAGTSSPTDTGAFLYLGKTRGTTAGSTTAVASADCLGRVSFQGSDGTDQVEAARVEAFVDGTPGANDMPGRLVFLTTADGASSPTERMRITSNGNFFVGGSSNKIDSTTSQEIQFHSYLTLGQFASGSCPGYLGWNITATSSAGTYKARTSGDRASVLTLNSGGDLLYSAATTTQTAGNDLTSFGERVRFLAAGGITFNGDTAAANALDDYEEGTWIPTVTGTDAGTFTLNAGINTFKYTKIGRVVYISGRINISGTSGTTGSVAVGNFPFTNAPGTTAQASYSALPVIHHDFDLAADAVGECFIELAPNTSAGVIYYLRDALSWESVKVGVITANETYFYITGYYFTD